MKFKVGDKVKVVKVINGASEKTLNKIGEIEKYNQNDKDYKVRFYEKLGMSNVWFYSEEELKLIQSKQFTKSDLKDGDIVTYRNGNKRIVQGESLKTLDGNNGYKLQEYRKDLTEKSNITHLDIIKVEHLTTVFERKEEILDEAEKRYLRDVIRPFKCNVRSIKRAKGNIKDFILISMKSNESIGLPYFEKGTMYKGMEANRSYTIEELRIIGE